MRRLLEGISFPSVGILISDKKPASWREDLKGIENNYKEYFTQARMKINEITCPEQAFIVRF